MGTGYQFTVDTSKINYLKSKVHITYYVNDGVRKLAQTNFYNSYRTTENVSNPCPAVGPNTSETFTGLVIITRESLVAIGL